MNTENLTSGKLLKRIRKALGLRQHEIVGNEITRNLVSMIENGKTPLNPNIANLIIRNINSISKERNSVTKGRGDKGTELSTIFKNEVSLTPSLWHSP